MFLHSLRINKSPSGKLRQRFAQIFMQILLNFDEITFFDSLNTNINVHGM